MSCNDDGGEESNRFFEQSNLLSSCLVIREKEGRGGRGVARKEGGPKTRYYQYSAEHAINQGGRTLANAQNSVHPPSKTTPPPPPKLETFAMTQKFPEER